MIEDFFKDIDRSWKLQVPTPVTLKIIGSSALHLKHPVEGKTKDSDIFEVKEVTLMVRSHLEKIAGKDSVLSKRHRLKVEFVGPGFPFLPPQPFFHRDIKINQHLKNIQLVVLDVVDVVVSKLLPFRAKDIDDIKSVIDLNLVDPSKLLERFLLSKEQFLMGSRANHLRSIVENLHRVQRDFLEIPETFIELPDYIDS